MAFCESSYFRCGAVKMMRAFDTSQFTQDDWKQLTDYVDLLIQIDQRIRNEKKEQDENKNSKF